MQRGIALVPEKRELFGTMTVEDNLLLGGYPPAPRAATREHGARGWTRSTRCSRG